MKFSLAALPAYAYFILCYIILYNALVCVSVFTGTGVAPGNTVSDQFKRFNLFVHRTLRTKISGDRTTIL